MLALWTLSCLVRPASASPVPTHAWVVADPDGEVAARKWATDVRSLLEVAGWRCLTPERIEDRIGEDSESLYRSCGTDVDCWRAAARHVSADSVVLVDRVDTDTVGLRVVDVGTGGAVRQGARPGRELVELVQELVLGEGQLAVETPGGGRIRVDGGGFLFVGPSWETSVPSGRHTVEVEADAFELYVAAPVVYPGQRTTVAPALVPVAAGSPQRGWLRWAAAGTLAATAAVVVVGATTGGRAVVP